MPLPDVSVVPAVWSRVTNLVVDRGEGSWLITRDGERYLDYSSGIGVVNTGHAHPRVVAAIQQQATKLLHGQQNIVFHEPGLRLYERLSKLLPRGPWGAFLSNSGAEAVEASVKLARVATGRPVVIGFRGGFHGRTAQAMALTTAKDVYRAAFEPLPGSVYHTPFPYCYRWPGGAHAPDADCQCDWEAQLDLLFHQVIYPDRVAAIIVEPVLGEGGYVVPPPSFLPRLREITRQHGILLIADEVQTGFGRTGEMFAVRHWDVEPDIVVLAKGIASGLPLSGIIARREILDRLPPGTHGGTYGGNVVACAAANATLDVIDDEGLVGNARERGAQFLAGLRALAASRSSIGDVRGLGLMLALEFISPGEGDGRVPNADLAKRVIAESLARRLLVLSAGSYANVVRIIPPLVTTPDEVDQALSILDEALTAAGA
jgi:4-aminobutyrate aminotransferase